MVKNYRPAKKVARLRYKKQEKPKYINGCLFCKSKKNIVQSYWGRSVCKDCLKFLRNMVKGWVIQVETNQTE